MIIKLNVCIVCDPTCSVSVFGPRPVMALTFFCADLLLSRLVHGVTDQIICKVDTYCGSNQSVTHDGIYTRIRHT